MVRMVSVCFLCFFISARFELACTFAAVVKLSLLPGLGSSAITGFSVTLYDREQQIITNGYFSASISARRVIVSNIIVPTRVDIGLVKVRIFRVLRGIHLPMNTTRLRSL